MVGCHPGVWYALERADRDNFERNSCCVPLERDVIDSSDLLLAVDSTVLAVLPLEKSRRVLDGIPRVRNLDIVDPYSMAFANASQYETPYGNRFDLSSENKYQTAHEAMLCLVRELRTAAEIVL